MKPEDLLAILRDRGFKVQLRDGAPVLIGNKDEATPALMECLKANRTELIEHLRAEEAKTAEVLF